VVGKEVKKANYEAVGVIEEGFAGCGLKAGQLSKGFKSEGALGSSQPRSDLGTQKWELGGKVTRLCYRPHMQSLLTAAESDWMCSQQPAALCSANIGEERIMCGGIDRNGRWSLWRTWRDGDMVADRAGHVCYGDVMFSQAQPWAEERWPGRQGIQRNTNRDAALLYKKINSYQSPSLTCLASFLSQSPKTQRRAHSIHKLHRRLIVHTIRALTSSRGTRVFRPV